jgi:hypothetical protein
MNRRVNVLQDSVVTVQQGGEELEIVLPSGKYWLKDHMYLISPTSKVKTGLIAVENPRISKSGSNPDKLHVTGANPLYKPRKLTESEIEFRRNMAAHERKMANETRRAQANAARLTALQQKNDEAERREIEREQKRRERQEERKRKAMEAEQSALEAGHSVEA